MTAIDDPFELNRFVWAREGDYARALAEPGAWRKRSHLEVASVSASSARGS